MKTGQKLFNMLLSSSIKRVLFLSFLLTILSSKATALNYYWVGGSGNWDQLSHWATTSGGTVLQNQIPTAIDDVFFDANSFSATGQAVNLNVLTVLAHSINFTGVTNTPSLTGPASNLLKLYGSLTFVAGMNFLFTGDVDFEATTPGQTITPANKNFLKNVLFNGIGGSWTLQGAFTVSGSIALNAGSFISNNQTVSCTVFSSSGTVTRTLNMGSSTFNISGNWDVQPTGMNLNSGTSVINCPGNGASDFRGGGFTYYDLNFSSAAAPATGTIRDDNIFHDVVFASKADIVSSNTFHNVIMNADGKIEKNNTYNNLTFSAGHTYLLSDGSTQTINGLFNANGTCGGYIDVHTNNPSFQATISHPPGTVTVSSLILKDIKTAGGATFTANNSVDLGNNTGWTINSAAPKNLYWIGNGGNWNDGNRWSLSSGGAPSGCSPSPIDNVFFDANSFSLPGQSVVVNVYTAYCNDMNWTGTANMPTLVDGGLPSGSTYLMKIYGSLKFVAGMNLSFAGEVYFEATTTGHTVAMGGNSFKQGAIFNGIGGGWTLLDAFSTNSILTLNAGTLNSNNQTVTALSFFSQGGHTRAIIMGSSIFNLINLWTVTSSGMTVNSGTSTINCSYAGGCNFNGAGFTYYDLNFTSPLDIAMGTIFDSCSFHDVVFFSKASIFTGSHSFHNVIIYGDADIPTNNIYNNLSFSAGHTYTLWSGTTQTINGQLTAYGNCGAFIDIHTNNSGAQATISHPGGAMLNSFLILKDIMATGVGNFVAGNSVDLGNNTGWIITSPTPKNLYWINDSGNWGDGNHWSLSSGGAPSGCAPTPLDNVFFDSNSFSLDSQFVTINVFTAYCKDMHWAAVRDTPIVAGVGGAGNLNYLVKIYGSLTLVPNMELTFFADVHFEAITTGKTINMAGQSFTQNVLFNGNGGGWTLQDSLSTKKLLILNGGTISTNNQKVIAAGFFSTGFVSKGLNMGSSVFNMSGSSPWEVGSALINLNSGTSVINCTAIGGGQFNGGGLVYNDLNFTSPVASGAGVINGNGTYHDVVFAANGEVWSSANFHNLTIDGDGQFKANNIYNDLSFAAGHTYTFGNGITQTINGKWMVQGSCTSYILLRSSTAGSFATVKKTSGTVLGYNIHIKDIHCSGGAVFKAYNSVDLGGNSGWNFLTLPPLLPPSIIIGPSSICAGATGVVYRIAPVQGAVYYTWTVPAGATIVSGQGDTLIVVNFGTAVSGNITVHSFDGCNYSSVGSNMPVVLASSLTPTVVLTANLTGQICTGATVIFTATAGNTGGSNITYSFKINGATVQSGSSNLFTSSSLSNGNVVTCNISLSGLACLLSTTAVSNSIVINMGQGGFNPVVSIAAFPSGSVCNGTNVVFTATATNNGTGIFTYDFKLNGISVQSGASNVYNTTTLSNGDNITCNISISSGSCYLSNTAVSNEISANITTCSCVPSIPNAFTPNGDGIHDEWIISLGNCQSDVAVWVYNRYGSLIYHSDKYRNDWKGTYQSKTCPDGTYYYLIKTINPSRGENIYKGNVTILR